MVCGRSHGLFTKWVETKALVNIRDVDIKKKIHVEEHCHKVQSSLNVGIR